MGNRLEKTVFALKKNLLIKLLLIFIIFLLLGLDLGLMGWSLLPNALRPFKVYCASPYITSQLVLFLWQTVEIDPLGHVRVVEAHQNFVQNQK